MENTTINDIRLSPHFMLTEFLKLEKYPDNIPTVQQISNLIYGCRNLLEPARGCFLPESLEVTNKKRIFAASEIFQIITVR